MNYIIILTVFSVIVIIYDLQKGFTKELLAALGVVLFILWLIAWLV